MKLEKTLYDRSYIYFLVFFAFVLAAFWLTYFTKVFEQENYRMHLHGLTLILWCLMLIIQPYLIKTKRYSLHKAIGKFSYVLVPVLVFTTVDLLHYRLQPNPLGTMDYFFVALVVNALIAFMILYGLALYHSKKSGIHARYMVCTVFPLFTPVTDRIISIYFPSLLKYFPTIEGNPIVPVFGFVLADLILIAFTLWDWQSHKKFKAFPLALIILVTYHYSVLNFYKFEFWRGFSEWIAGQ